MLSLSPSFLQTAYQSIEYRKGRQSIRNIPYIVIDKSRQIEDNFLTYFRFIECYNKSKGINGKQYDFFNKVLSEKISLIKISQDEKKQIDARNCIIKKSLCA